MKEITFRNINIIWKKLQPGDYFKYSPEFPWPDVESAARRFDLEVKKAGGFIGIVIKRVPKKKRDARVQCFPG
ncbi:MAG: hypothetical protein ABIK99_04375 [candidate division WOR-3 bacterium]